MEKKILLGHGSGGKLSHQLIKNLFIKHFNNSILSQLTDSAILEISSNNIAFTTDSYVVDPIFFPGGNIGKLAVCGTINDLSVSGAIPKYISASFIIEEGFSISELELIVASMAEEAKKAQVMIVAGDTKVVNKGQCDKIFITTTGIGIFTKDEYKKISTGEEIKEGDKILINGNIAEHGMAVLAARNFTNFKLNINSDCASLNFLIRDLLETNCKIKFMRDATRGGIASVLNEIVEKNNVGIEIDEASVPISDNVKGICELLGLDPFYIANEGKVIIICDPDDAQKAITIMKQHELGKNSAIIGQVINTNYKKVFLKTVVGGTRIIDMLADEQLPRIC